jgi:outer membrane lipoprotein-sorting protein
MSKLLTLLAAAALAAQAQTIDQLVARLNTAAASFTGAKADIKRTTYLASLKQSEVESGTIVVRKAGSKTESLIDITGENAYKLVFHGNTFEKYQPGMNQIDEYDARQYRNLVQAILVLGFGMSGKDLVANYKVSNARRETVAGRATTAVDLAPKSAELVDKLHLNKVEIWFADDGSPVKEKAYVGPDTWTVEYSNVQLNVKIPANALDLPKGAVRVKH